MVIVMCLLLEVIFVLYFCVVYELSLVMSFVMYLCDVLFGTFRSSVSTCRRNFLYLFASAFCIKLNIWFVCECILLLFNNLIMWSVLFVNVGLMYFYSASLNMFFVLSVMLIRDVFCVIIFFVFRVLCLILEFFMFVLVGRLMVVLCVWMVW